MEETRRDRACQYRQGQVKEDDPCIPRVRGGKSPA
jgi:hypothetical protein